MTIDSFIFKDELDILLLRIDYLYDSVDYFVFSDMSVDAANNYSENKDKFEKYKDKIHLIDSSADDEIQLDIIRRKVSDIACEGSLILFSDYYEIPNKKLFKDISESIDNVEAICLIQKKYLLSILNLVDTQWFGTVAFKLENFKKCNLSEIIGNKYSLMSIDESGFCFSSFTSKNSDSIEKNVTEISSDFPIEFYRHNIIFENTFNRVEINEGVLKRKNNAMQIPLEIESLQLYVDKIKPKVVVEIGSATGGTLARWFELPSVETIISIDLPNGIHGGQDIRERYSVVSDFYKQSFTSRKEFHPIDGDSKNKEIISQLETVLAGRKVDFLFIDGDHTLEGVTADFENYKGYLSEKSLVGFHDIIDSKFHRDNNCHVYDLWKSIKGMYKSKEFIHTELLDPVILPHFGNFIADGGFAGIGVIDINQSRHEISLIVPVYSNVEATIRNINITLSCSTTIKEVLIFSNGSTSDENSKLKEAFSNNPIVKIKINDKPIGFIKAVNELFKMAKFENILCMNSDAHIGLGWENRLLPMLSNPKYGIVGPIMIRDFILGCCFIVKKSTLNKLGLLNEGFGMGYVDDVEFSHRVVRNGLELGFATFKSDFDSSSFVDFPIVHTQGDSFKLLENVKIHELNDFNTIKYNNFKSAEIVYVIHNWNYEDIKSLIIERPDDTILSVMKSGEDFEKTRFDLDIIKKIHLFECTNEMDIDVITESILKGKIYHKLTSISEVRQKNGTKSEITWLAKFDDYSSMGILSQRILENLSSVDFVCQKIIGETETNNKVILESFKESRRDIGIMFSYPDMYSQLDEYKVKVIYTGADTTGGIPNFTQNINNADYVLTPSNYSKRIMENLGVKPQIFVFPHGIDPDLFKFTKRSLSNKFRFLYVGECSDRKGIFHLLEAFLFLFKNNQDVELHIKSNSSMLFYGSDKLLKIKEENSNIHLHFSNEGHTSVVELYNECHAYVYPSRADSFGMTLLESMACGLPVISTDLPGATEIIDSRYYKIKSTLVPVKDHPWMLGEWGEPDTFSLVKAMKEVYINYSEIVSSGKLRENSDYVRENFSWQAVVSDFETNILPKLVKKRKVITLMTSFNRPAYLKDTLNSIIKIKQDEVENHVYLVENSDEESKKIVNEFISTITEIPIKVYNSETNLGQRGSLLQMLEDINIDEYDYLQLTDQDNIFHEPISTYLDILDYFSDIWFATGYMSKEHQELGWRSTEWGNLCEKRTLRAGHMIMRVEDFKRLLPIKMDSQYGQLHNSSWHAGLDWELSYWNKNSPGKNSDTKFVLCLPGGVEHVGIDSTMYSWDVKANEYDLETLRHMRKEKIKVYDCFTFLNEIELLKIRLELLKDVVDYHVIIESNLTYSGKEKPYYFEQNSEQFEEWKNKIIYIKIEQSADGLLFDSTSYNPNSGSWQLEREQRNAMSMVRDLIADNAIVIIGDLDEIPYSGIIDSFRKNSNAVLPSTIIMNLQYYYFNNKSVGYNKYWAGSVVCNGKQFKEQSAQHLRDIRNQFNYVGNGGNHFSFLGLLSVESIRYKLSSTTHTEVNRPEITSEENIMESILTGKDILNRENENFVYANPSEYPDEIKDMMKKYPHLVREIS